MSSFVSSRREFVSEVSGKKTSVSGWAAVALLAGIAMMVIGLKADVTALFAVGSLAFVCSFLYLNSMFWAKRMDRSGYRPSSYRGYHI